MKATLEFNLPEEQSEFNIVVKANEYAVAWWEIKQVIRNKMKYENITPEEYSILSQIQEQMILEETERNLPNE